MRWRRQSSLAIGRSGHVCGALKYGTNGDKTIIVAGGKIDHNLLTDSVETLSVADNDRHFADAWTTGPKMPLAISYAAGATTPNQLAMFVFGGINNHGEGTRNVFRIQCSGFLQCHWTEMGQELGRNFAKGLALVLPPTTMGQKWDTISPNCAMSMSYINIYANKPYALGQTVGCSQQGDGICDGHKNHNSCHKDGGDCCLPKGSTDCLFCEEDSNCICHLTGELHCNRKKNLKTRLKYVSNDNYSDFYSYLTVLRLTFPECHFDGGRKIKPGSTVIDI